MADVATPPDNKENAVPDTNGTARQDEEDNDPYAVSSDSEDDDKPPPPINIGVRSTELGQLKESLMTPAKFKRTESEEKKISEQERLGKEGLVDRKGAFEGKSKPKNVAEDGEGLPEREKLTTMDKDKYSKFKDRFEHIDDEIAKFDEEKKKNLPVTEIHGAGVEKLSLAKDKFENLHNEPVEIQREAIEVNRSDAEKRRVNKTFNQAKQEEPKDCAICAKMVYPVEKLLAEGRVYHYNCFKCSKCAKSLSVTTYHSHEKQLYCKLHMLEIFHPETYKNLDPNAMEELEDDVPDDDEEYAKVSKPKVLRSDVVKSGLKSTDDLETIRSLKSTKTQWEENRQKTPERKSFEDSEMFEQGKVKNRLSKFTDAGEEIIESEEEEDDAERDPNIIRSSKKTKKDKLDIEVGKIKGKWETGEVEKAEKDYADRTEELDEIKKGVKIRERFREKTGEEPLDEEALAARKSVLDQEQLDTTFTKDAKQRFLKGEAFQDSAPVERALEDIHFKELGNFKEKFEKGEIEDMNPVEKAAIDARCEELGNIKAAFEKAKEAGEPLDARAEEKQRKIETEFLKFKKLRKMQELKEQRDREEAAIGQGEGAPIPDDDVRHSTDMGSIKNRFEQGTAFQSAEPIKKQEELEIKVAGKARQKFKEIDAEGPAAPTMNKAHAESKWNKDQKSVPEPINKREIVADDEEEEELEVRNILSKFKNMEKGEGKEEPKAPKPVRMITPPPENYKSEIESQARERDPNVVLSGADTEGAKFVKTDAKNLKARFEAGPDLPNETAEEKKKRLEEEFNMYKELKASQPVEEEEVPEEKPKEEIKIVPEHATKMTQKWEKIHKKEAKKAQKTMGQRPAGASFFLRTPAPIFCFVCHDKVYLAEKMECDGRFVHKKCLKCKTCNITLRQGSCAAGPYGVYCTAHYKELYCNMTRPLFNGRPRETTPVA